MTEEEKAAAAKAEAERLQKEADDKKNSLHLDNKELEALRKSNKHAQAIIEAERARRLKAEQLLRENGIEMEIPQGLSEADVERIVARAMGTLSDNISKLTKDNEEMARTLLSREGKQTGEGAGAPPQPIPPSDEISTVEVQNAINFAQNFGVTLSEKQAKTLATRIKTGEKLSFDEIGKIAELK